MMKTLINKNNPLITSIRIVLRGLLEAFNNGKIKEEHLVKILNEATHYNPYYKMYFYEMLIIEALETNRIPNSPMIISGLFNSSTTEDFIYPDFNSNGTRLKVLKKLKLNKSLKLYKDFLRKEEIFTETGKDFSHKKLMSKVKETVYKELEAKTKK